MNKNRWKCGRRAQRSAPAVFCATTSPRPQESAYSSEMPDAARRPDVCGCRRHQNDSMGQSIVKQDPPSLSPADGSAQKASRPCQTIRPRLAGDCRPLALYAMLSLPSSGRLRHPLRQKAPLRSTRDAFIRNKALYTVAEPSISSDIRRHHGSLSRECCRGTC